MLKKKKMDNKNKTTNKTANDFINVADIDGNILYTKDGHIISYIKLETVSISTMSKTDIRLLLQELCREFAGFNNNIRLFKISKPIDISSLIKSYKDMYRTTLNPKQKELLREATLFLHEYSTGRTELENNHYMIVIEKEENVSDLRKKVSDITRKFASAKIGTEVLNAEEIARLCNLFANPSYANENMDLNEDISIIEDFVKGEK